MENNVHASPFSPPSENGFMGNNSTSFATLIESSTVVVGSNRGHPSFANINSSDNLSPLLPPLSSPPSSPSPLPSPILAVSSELDVPPQEPNKQMEPQLDVVAFTERPNGMPLGSENNPKPTMELPIPFTFTSQEREDFLKPIILIVPAGANIVDAVINFGRNRDVTILVHHASGLVSEVNLCNPLSISDDLSFLGNSYMFSLSGFYTKNLSPSPPKNIPYSSFNIQFSRGRAPQVFGGLVGRKLIAAEPVQVMASIIKNHDYHDAACPITNPNVQPVMESFYDNCHAAIVSNALSGITNITANHPGFSVGASTSTPINVQSPAPPSTATDVIMLYNNPTNQDDN